MPLSSPPKKPSAPAAPLVYSILPDSGFLSGGYAVRAHATTGGTLAEQELLSRRYVTRVPEDKAVAIIVGTKFDDRDVVVESTMGKNSKPLNLAMHAHLANTMHEKPFSARFESLHEGELRFKVNINSYDNKSRIGTLRMKMNFENAAAAERFLASDTPLIGRVSFIDNAQPKNMTETILAMSESGLTAQDLQRSRAAFNQGKDCNMQMAGTLAAHGQFMAYANAIGPDGDRYVFDTTTELAVPKALANSQFVNTILDRVDTETRAKMLDKPQLYELNAAHANKVERMPGVNKAQSLLVAGRYFDDMPDSDLAQIRMIDNAAGKATKQAILNIMQEAGVPAPKNGIVDVKAFIAELAKGDQGVYAEQLQKHGGRADQLLTDATRKQMDDLFDVTKRTPNPTRYAQTKQAPSVKAPSIASSMPTPALQSASQPPATYLTIPTPVNEQAPARLSTVETAEDIGKKMGYLKLEKLDPREHQPIGNAISLPPVEYVATPPKKLSMR